MGNEASMEGGEGALAGLPEGLAPDGKGGFIHISTGAQADLSHLSEEDRKRLAGAMSRVQTRPSGSQQPTRTPQGLSKSRTVDAFGEGPSSRPRPGRSPSSLSLFESRFRQEPKDSDQPRTSMFSTGFLSGANPLSAVSSAVSSASTNIPKFSLFGDEEEEQVKQGEKPPGPSGAPGPGKSPQQQGARPPQQVPPKAQGSPQQKGGPPTQNPGAKPGGPGPQQQGPKPGGPGPQQQGPKPGGPGPQQQGPKPGGPGPQQQGPKPGGPGLQQQGPKPGGPGPQQQGPKPGGPGPQQQGPKPGGPGPQQQGPKPGGPGPQQQGPKPGGPGPQQQGSKPQGPGPQQQGSGKPAPEVASKPGAQAPGPPKAGHPPGKAGGGLCPLCKTTELNTQIKDQPPNYSTCTQCKQQVCSLCGFSPPDSAGKEWLCLNCQMQRAMGGMEPPGPPMMKPPPKQGSAPPSPQKKEPPTAKASPKTEPGKKPPMLTKQQSIADTGKGVTPPATPKEKSPGPGPQGAPKGPPGSQPGPPGNRSGQPPPLQKPGPGGAPKIDPKTGRPVHEPGKTPSPKGSPVPSPAKTKQEGGFFGGFGFGGLTDMAKPPASSNQAADSVTSLFGGFGGSSKTQDAAPQESVTGKFFSGFGGLTETAKPTAAPTQTAEATSGKMFGFGSSILSSASNLIASTIEGETPASPPESPPGSPPDSPIDSGADSPPGSPPDSGSDSPPDTPPAYSKDESSQQPAADKTEEATSKPRAEPAKPEKSSCPLCKVDLNVGSGDAPNYSTCTECMKMVCNLCGFNPTPHISEKEWLCLNCQTQRALSGQLGDIPPPLSPSKLPEKHQPTPPSSPARALSSTPSSPAPTTITAPVKELARTPSVTQAPDEEPESDAAVAHDKTIANAVSAKNDETQPAAESTQVESDGTQIKDSMTQNDESVPNPPEKITEASTLPSDSIPEEKTHVGETEAERGTETVDQSSSPSAEQISETEQPEQSQSVGNDTISGETDPTQSECKDIEEAPASAKEPAIMSKADEQVQICGEKSISLEPTSEMPSAMSASQEISSPDNVPSIPVDSELDKLSTEKCSEEVSSIQSVDSLYEKSVLSAAENQEQANTEQTSENAEAVGFVSTTAIPSTAALSKTIQEHPFELDQPATSEKQECASIQKVTEENANMVGPVGTSNIPVPDVTNSLQEQTIGQGLPEQLDPVIPEDRPAVKLETETLSSIQSVADLAVSEHGSENRGDSQKAVDEQAQKDLEQANKIPDDKKIVEKDNVSVENEENKQRTTDNKVEQEILSEGKGSSEVSNQILFASATANAPIPVPADATGGITTIPSQVGDNVHYVVGEREEPKKTDSAEIPEVKELSPQGTFPIHTPETISSSSTEKTAENGKDGLLPDSLPHETISSVQTENKKEVHTSDHFSGDKKYEPPVSAQEIVSSECDLKGETFTHDKCKVLSVLEDSMEQPTGETKGTDDLTIKTETEIERELQKIGGEEQMHDRLPKSINSTTTVLDEKGIIVPDTKIDLKAPAPDVDKSLDQTKVENSNEKSDLPSTVTKQDASENKAESFPNEQILKCSAVLNTDLEEKQKRASPLETLASQNTNVDLSPPFQNSNSPSCNESIPNENQDRAESSQTVKIENDSQSSSQPVEPVVEPVSLPVVISKQDKDERSREVASCPETQKKEEEVQSLIKPMQVDDLGERKDDGAAAGKGMDKLPEPVLSNTTSLENTLTSPSDLAKLENTVLPIIEAQITSAIKDDSQDLSEQGKGRRRLEVLPMSPEVSSEEDGHGENKTVAADAGSLKKERKKLSVPIELQVDLLGESSEGESSPSLQRKLNVTEDKDSHGDSVGSADEEYIRKEMIDMSADEDASPSIEVSPTQTKIRDQDSKAEQNVRKDSTERSEAGKSRRLLKNSSISPEDDPDNKNVMSMARSGEIGQKPSVESAAGVRHFKTIELNSTATARQMSDDGELESLTDSPDDKSRGEGSSSLHASSFTPGTSPTSLSSLDEDSDSSPSHNRSSGEGKQHRKAKHRQPGQMLPTIEDSSEEEELREEEELLREQEKQKGIGKKSKKDKEEIRAQRRRDHTKTPPSNLSPIEDASPTEELRQEAEMEEIRRSSCSDFSPSMDSEPEGFEILPDKITAVQKVYQLPTSVSLYSPTDDQHADNGSKGDKADWPLKTADEILKSTAETVEPPPGKESLYSGTLIEDYDYESRTEDTKKMEPGKISLPEKPKQLRSPDEVYEDMMKKKKEMMLEGQEVQQVQLVKEILKPEVILTPTDPNNAISAGITTQLNKDGKPLLDAEAAYEELMKRQRAVLTPGTSPTQTGPNIEDPSDGIQVVPTTNAESVPSRRVLPIPDLRVTQCSSGEEESGEESTVEQKQDSEPTPVVSTDKKSTAVVFDASDQVPDAALVSECVSESTVMKEVKTAQPQPSDLPEQSPDTTLSSSKDAAQSVEIDQPGVVDLSRFSTPSQISFSPTPVIDSMPSHTVLVSGSPLPTVPQYTATVPSVVSTACPISTKPAVLQRGVSQEKTDIPIPPPLPPPTLPKPSVYPKRIPPQIPPRPEQVSMTNVVPNMSVRQPPPVPPKPSSIPAGLTFSHRPGESVKPPIAPKPLTQPPSPAHAPIRPTVLPTSSPDIALNLSPSTESKPTSPSKSPSSPRFGKSLHETYVVITLPSQPSSPVESVTTQAPSRSSPASPQRQMTPQSPSQPEQTPPPPPPPPPSQPHSPRVPLAFTRITESIESQEICGPEKVVSSMSHVYEAISASTQPPSTIPNVLAQVVTTEVQRTTVSVVHERAPPLPPTPRATGISVLPENLKTQPVQIQSEQVYTGEVVDLRTPKLDAEMPAKGVDLSSELRHQPPRADSIGRQTSAVQSSVINLSTDTTVSVVTDSITILTCTATIAYGSNGSSQSTSMPLQLTTAKSFEPLSQIIYRPVHSQPERPINLSMTTAKSNSPPVMTVPASVTTGMNTCQLDTGLSGAVDLTTAKPVQTMVSLDGSTSEVITAVISEDNGKPVDLTAGRRAVCCDVVYNLPFASSCTTQQPTVPLPEDRFGYRDDHYQYDRSPFGMRGLSGIKPSMSDTNLAEAGLFFYKSKNSYDYNSATDCAVDLTSGKISGAGEAVDYSSKAAGAYSGMAIPHSTQARITSAVGTLFGATSVLRSSNGVVYSSVAAPIPSTYAITTQPGSIFSTTYNTLSNMHASETMPSLSTLQNQPMTRSQSFLSTVAVTLAEESQEMPLNLEIVVSKDDISTALSEANANTRVAAQDSFTDASLDAIAASLEALSSPMVPGDGQYQMERELLELEKMKQQHLAEKLEWERQEIQRFREHEQLLVQKELEELQAMKQQILCQQEEERQAHLMMQKETYAQQQEQLEQIQRLQEQLRQQLEEQKFRQMFPSEIHEQSQPEALIVGGDKKIDSGVQTDEEDTTMDKAYTAGRKKKSAKKSVDSCVQTDDEDQDELVPSRGRRSRSRGGKYSTGDRAGVSIQALTEISVQTDSSGMLRGHSVQMDAKVEYPDSDGPSSPQRDKRRPTPLEIGDSPHLRADTSTLQVAPAPPKSPKVLYSPLSPCVSPSKSLDFMSYDKSLGDTSPQRIQSAVEPSKTLSAATRGPKVMQRSMSDPKPMSPTAEERAATNMQCPDGYTGKESPSGTPCGTQKKVKRTLPNPPSEEEVSSTGQIAYSTGSARRRLCRSTNMARAKILQDIDRELDLVERESSKLRKKQAELDEEEKEIDAKLRYLEMGINRRKDALLKEREKRERAYLQSVAEDRDYMSDSEVSNIREMSRGGREEEVAGHGLERPRTAPQSELDQFIPPQTKHDVQYGKYSQYQYPQQTLYQQSLYQSQQPYQSQSIYSSVPSLTASQEQSYHQMLLLQQKARQQATLLSELAATKMSPSYDVIRSQPDASSYLSGKYGNHLDLHGIEDRVGSIAGSPMSTVSADSFYSEVEAHHQTPRSYLLLEEAAELAKGPSGLSSTSYGLAEKELAKAERLLRQTAADVGSDYMSSTSRLHSYGKTQEEEDTMEEPYELKLLKQQLKQEFRRSTGGTESLEQLAGLPHHYYTPSTSLSNAAYRAYPKTEKYSISRLTLEKQAAKQLPSSVHYQKHKNTSNIGKYSSSLQESRTLETDYSSYLASSSSSPRSSRLLQDEITFGLRKNIAEQQKYLGSNLGANLAGSLNLGQSLHLGAGLRSSLGEDSVYPSGSRSRPSSRPSSVYGLDLSIKRDTSSSSLRLKAEGDPSSDTSAFQTPSGRTKPTSLPIGQGSRGRIPIVAQNSEEESPLSPVGQPMGMARASAGPLPPISADSRDQFGSCLSLQDPQQQHLRDDPNRVRSYAMVDDLQGTMSDSEALSDSLVVLNTDDPGNSHENFTNAYHLRREETDWFDKPRDGRSESGQGLDRRQMKSQHYPFPHTRVKLQRDPKDRSVSGNGLGIRVVGGKDVPGSNGEIGAYVAKVLPGGTAEQTGKILEGMQVLEWNSISLTGKTYEEVQGLVGQQCEEAELCVRCDLNMLMDSEGSHLDLHDLTKAGDRPPRSPGVDPKQLAAELQKVSQQQVPSSSLVVADKGPHALSGTASVASSTIPSPGQPGSPSVSKKRHSKTSETVKTPSHPITGEIQLQINYDKQLGNLIVHVLQARNLSIQDNNSYSDPFVKVYLLPGRGQVMVVQNASAESKRRSKHAPKSQNPEWNQTVIYKNIHLEQLRKKTLEVSVWDYDKSSSNDFLGEVLIDLSNTTQLDNAPRWLPLKEQSETDHHRRSHSGQSRQHSPKPPGQSSQHSPKTFSHGNQDSPKSSVIKSRSHGIFPDPGKDTQVPTIEKSHSSPVTSKPSPSEGQARAHGTPRAHGKSGAARAHLDDSGASIATAESAAQQHRLQPTQNGRLSLRRHRHSVVGVLTIQRPQSEPLANEIRDGRHLTLRKAMSEERPHPDGASRGLRSGDTPVTAASLDSGLSGSAYSLLEDEEGGTNVVDSAIFQVPKFGKIPNGTDMPMSSQGFGDTEGKTQMMGEIKIALKKEMKTEGEQLVLEILQCRNITYKFKSPDHLPDLYVKLYVVNVATQKRIIKKKTRVCRHDREPSFNETFRFSMNPTGHSLQLFLLSNGGKFVKKTVIGEAYVWLDKVDLRKRVVSWHKLLASTALVHS